MKITIVSAVKVCIRSRTKKKQKLIYHSFKPRIGGITSGEAG
jgi:hypothetical protein